MMQSHYTPGIDQDVAPLLLYIAVRSLRQSSLADFPGRGPPGPESPHLPECRLQHTVFPVQFPGGIQEKRIVNIVIHNILSGGDLSGKGDSRKLQLMLSVCILLHLQEVTGAGQSTQMPVKDHQQPAAQIIVQAMDLSLCIWQDEGNSPPAAEAVFSVLVVCHCFFTRSDLPYTLLYYTSSGESMRHIRRNHMKQCSLEEFKESLAPWLDSNYIRSVTLDHQGLVTFTFMDGVSDTYEITDCGRERVKTICDELLARGIPVREI
jgi:hypothetical protein